MVGLINILNLYYTDLTYNNICLFLCNKKKNTNKYNVTSISIFNFNISCKIFSFHILN